MTNQLFRKETEDWRPVVGYEGRYEVSDLGAIRSLNYMKSGIIRCLKQLTNRDGYLFVTLPNPGGANRRKQFRLHSLVAAAFIGPRPRGFDVNHKNGIKSDNRPENLEYVTESRNTKHSFEMGLQKPIAGSDHYAAVLDERKVRVILELADLGVSVSEIASLFSIKPRHAQKIKSRLIWKHVKLN